MATDLAKLVVRLEAQSSQLLSELEKSNRQIQRFASDTQKTLRKWSGDLVGFFSARAIAQFSSDVLKAQGDLVGMAERAGDSVEAISRLGYAADQSESNLDTLAKGLGALSDRAAEAAEKGGSSAAAFKKLGIDVKDNEGNLKRSTELFIEIAEQLSQYQDGTAKAALANDLFSKSGRELIPLLNKGADGIRELAEESDALGGTISQGAAEAADNFGDTLAKVGTITRGVMGQALQEVLPVLQMFADKQLEAAKNGETLSHASEVIAAGFKLLVNAGQIVGEVFDRVGSALGGAAAALVAVAQGEFSRAVEIIKEANLDHIENVKQTGAEIAAVWTATGSDIVASAQATDAQLKKTLAFGGNSDAVQEVQVTAKKMDKSAMEEFYSDLDDMTKTQSERAIEEYNKQKVALDELYNSGIVGVDKYNERIQEALDELLPEFEVTAKKVTETAESTMSEFEKAVAQNSVDIIADALTSGFDEGAEGILRSFAVMLQKLAAQALAAEIAKKIFGGDGSTSGGGGGGGGWWQIAMNAAGSYFGGGAAEGRDNVPAGMSLMVGERGPEMWTPNVPGSITPMREMVGSPKVEVPLQINNINDPEQIPTFFRSNRGAQTFINLLTENASTARQILQGG
jgi:hypothetical protein